MRILLIEDEHALGTWLARRKGAAPLVELAVDESAARRPGGE